MTSKSGAGTVQGLQCSDICMVWVVYRESTRPCWVRATAVVPSGVSVIASNENGVAHMPAFSCGLVVDACVVGVACCKLCCWSLSGPI